MKDYSQPFSTPYYDELKRNGIRLPAILCQIRTEEGRRLRTKGIERFRFKFLTPRTDRISNTLTGVQKDNLIMTTTKSDPKMEYRQNPTKEDLLEYFTARIRIRKMTPPEALRLMDVSEQDIDRMINATEPRTLKDGTVKTQKAISKTALYRLAGNIIVVSCLYHLLRTIFISGQPEYSKPRIVQLSLF